MVLRVVMAVVLLASAGCSKKDDSKDKGEAEPAAAPEAQPDEPSGGPPPEATPPPDDEGANPLAAKGEDVDRLCDWYGDAKSELDGEEAKPPAVESCKKTMASRTPEQRQQIADCANACGALDGVADCFDDFGKDSFPACGGEGEDEEEEEGEE